MSRAGDNDASKPPPVGLVSSVTSASSVQELQAKILQAQQQMLKNGRLTPAQQAQFRQLQELQQKARTLELDDRRQRHLAAQNGAFHGPHGQFQQPSSLYSPAGAPAVHLGHPAHRQQHAGPAHAAYQRHQHSHLRGQAQHLNGHVSPNNAQGNFNERLTRKDPRRLDSVQLHNRTPAPGKAMLTLDTTVARPKDNLILNWKIRSCDFHPSDRICLYRYDSKDLRNEMTYRRLIPPKKYRQQQWLSLFLRFHAPKAAGKYDFRYVRESPNNDSSDNRTQDSDNGKRGHGSGSHADLDDQNEPSGSGIVLIDIGKSQSLKVQVQGDDVLPTLEYIHSNLTKQGGSSAIWSCTMQFDRLVRQLHTLPAAAVPAFVQLLQAIMKSMRAFSNSVTASLNSNMMQTGHLTASDSMGKRFDTHHHGHRAHQGAGNNRNRSGIAALHTLVGSLMKHVLRPQVAAQLPEGLRQSLQYWLSLACPVCGEFFSLFKLAPSATGSEEKMALRAHARENHGQLQCDIYDLFSLPPNELSSPTGRVVAHLQPQLSSWIESQKKAIEDFSGHTTAPQHIMSSPVVKEIQKILAKASPKAKGKHGLPKVRAAIHPLGLSAVGCTLRPTTIDLGIFLTCDDSQKQLDKTLLDTYASKLIENLRKLGHVIVEERVHGSIPVINLQPDASLLPPTDTSRKDGDNSLLYRIRVHDEISLCRTELLHAYLACNPKLRTLAHIIEMWSGARDINDASRGTLSSYAFLVMLISVLQRRPQPALPVLQLLPPKISSVAQAAAVENQDRAVPAGSAGAGEKVDDSTSGPASGVEAVGSYEPLPRVWVCDYQNQPRDTYFCNLRQNPRPSLQRQYSATGMNYNANLKNLRAYCDLNTESTASLLLAFFEYYTKEFDFCQEVVSIRVPAPYRMTKNEKDDRCGWKLHGRFCIEDPFDVSLDLAQSVKHTGMTLIRDEFARALSIFAGAELNVRRAEYFAAAGETASKAPKGGKDRGGSSSEQSDADSDPQANLQELNQLTSPDAMQDLVTVLCEPCASLMHAQQQALQHQQRRHRQHQQQKQRQQQ